MQISRNFYCIFLSRLSLIEKPPRNLMSSDRADEVYTGMFKHALPSYVILKKIVQLKCAHYCNTRRTNHKFSFDNPRQRCKKAEKSLNDGEYCWCTKKGSLHSR
jgi:hypothetical protein